MATFRDMTFVRGDDWTFTLTVDEDGLPSPLTGYAYRCQVRKKYDDPAPLTEADVEIDEPGGVVTFRFPRTETQALKGKYVYDVEETDPDGVLTTPFVGNLTSWPDVTR